ncbi:MAG: type II toxin-antitoxin system VapC family toxin [Actinobacteria bacterium]|nr:MAG: type II toxin-antitoxin system VapC family toxin [Actinomycetota bacterium]
MTSVLLDSHVIQWWSAEPDRLSQTATQALEAADEVAVASISWFELAWLADHERILVTVPIRSWLEQLAAQVRSVGTTPAIASTAVALPSTFPGDKADRIIYATAVEQGWPLVTKDRRLRRHRHPRPVTIW